jgi:dihydrofolate reductase
VHSLDQAIAAAGAVEALRVIGGAEVYRLCLARAAVVYLTEVDAEVEGDVHFPRLEPGDWRERAREAHPADDKHAYPFAFVTLERRAS